MLINNFETIENFMEFEADSYYKFELLVRNTDGMNVLYKEGYSNTNKNILIKAWYVDSEKYYKSIKNEMIQLANLTGARLYMCLDRKSSKKTLLNLQYRFMDMVKNCMFGDDCSVKTINKAFASESSKVEASCKGRKTLMFDIDISDLNILNDVSNYITRRTKRAPYLLRTKKGWHLFCYREFPFTTWEDALDEIVDVHFQTTKFENTIAEIDYKNTYKNILKNAVSVIPNNLGLVYFNKDIEHEN